MRQTTIWDFLPQESSTEAKSTNQRNTMKFESLEEILDYIRRNLSTSGSVGNTEPFTPDERGESEHNSDYCIDCQLDYLESKETLLLASVNVAILDVMMNTLNQESAIRNEQADTLVKLAQVRTMLLGAN